MILTLDTGYIRQRFDAAYLVIEGDRAAFVDSGTSHCTDKLVRDLESRNLAREAVDYVILTHVHLDHAGGAGTLMAQLPNARLVVHPRGAPHMIDPSRLIAGATAVYGEEKMGRLYGEIRAVPASRVLQADDGFRLELNGRPLLCLDTPGHARHHICIVDERSQGIFCGDSFGLCYPELAIDGIPFIVPTTSPVQFEPQAWLTSLQRLMKLQPQRMYLTHFGEVGAVTTLASDLARRITGFASMAQQCSHLAGETRHRALVDGQWQLLLAEARGRSGAPGEDRIRDLLGLDVEINAQGLGVWLDRLRRGA